MADIFLLRDAMDRVGLPYVIRKSRYYDGFEHMFIGKPEDASSIHAMDDNFETTELASLLTRHKFYEFENGKLVSWSAS